MKKQEFKSKSLPGISKEEFNDEAKKAKLIYAGKTSRSLKTNEEYRFKKQVEGIRNSKKHAEARLKNLEGRDMKTPERLKAVTEACKEEVTCPHCGKAGARSGMKSWHFDHCKENPNRVPRSSKHKKRR